MFPCVLRLAIAGQRLTKEYGNAVEYNFHSLASDVKKSFSLARSEIPQSKSDAIRPLDWQYRTTKLSRDVDITM